MPALPQAMQWNKPLSGVTMKFGLLWSSWNGQRPIQSLLPCFFSSTPRLLDQRQQVGPALHALDVGFRDAPGMGNLLSGNVVKLEVNFFVIVVGTSACF